MNKWIIGIGIGLAALVLVAAGVMAAGLFWTGRSMMPFGWSGSTMMGALRGTNRISDWLDRDARNGAQYGCGQNSGYQVSPGGMMGNNGYGSGMMRRGVGGMMGGYSGSYGAGSAGSCAFINNPGEASGTRIPLEKAQTALETYLTDQPDLALAEIMEFENNFYGVVVEKDSGKGAMELLVDPYTGQVYPEHGPNMMWNEKYGHMGNWYATTGTALSLEDARSLAQTALDEQLPGAEVEGKGIAFYGYYTFDYTIDGVIAGMLSVNNNGQTWLHTWHGGFIGEVEFDE